MLKMGAMDYTADELRAAVESRHSCRANLFYVATVINTFAIPDWDSRVHVFDLEGHPTATRAFAWSFPRVGSGEQPIYVVLEHAGLRGPYDAVQVALASDKAAAVPRPSRAMQQQPQQQQKADPEAYGLKRCEVQDPMSDDAEDIQALSRVINRLQAELAGATSEERRQWLRRVLEATIDVRAHIALESGATFDS